MTWADLAVMVFIQWLTNKFTGIVVPMDNYPKVKAFMAHMEALPKLAEHIKNRPAADF